MPDSFPISSDFHNKEVSFLIVSKHDQWGFYFWTVIMNCWSLSVNKSEKKNLQGDQVIGGWEKCVHTFMSFYLLELH